MVMRVTLNWFIIMEEGKNCVDLVNNSAEFTTMLY